MIAYQNKRVMLYWAAKLGIAVSESNEDLKLLQLDEVQIIDLPPEILVMIRSVIAKKTLLYRRKPIDTIKRGLLISFQNVFDNFSTEPVLGERLLQE